MKVAEVARLEAAMVRLLEVKGGVVGFQEAKTEVPVEKKEEIGVEPFPVVPDVVPGEEEVVLEVLDKVSDTAAYPICDPA
jgi:hypothetical protein